MFQNPRNWENSQSLVTLHVPYGHKAVYSVEQKNLSKFGDTCSVLADGLCIGCLGQWAVGKKFKHAGNFLLDPVHTLQHRIVGGGRPVQREVGEGVVVDQHRHLLRVARRRRLALGQPHAEGDVERPVAYE